MKSGEKLFFKVTLKDILKTQKKGRCICVYVQENYVNVN